jgi:hypothetical protein
VSTIADTDFDLDFADSWTIGVAADFAEDRGDITTATALRSRSAALKAAEEETADLATWSKAFTRSGKRPTLANKWEIARAKQFFLAHPAVAVVIFGVYSLRTEGLQRVPKSGAIYYRKTCSSRTHSSSWQFVVQK